MRFSTMPHTRRRRAYYHYLPLLHAAFTTPKALFDAIIFSPILILFYAAGQPLYDD